MPPGEIASAGGAAHGPLGLPVWSQATWGAWNCLAEDRAPVPLAGLSLPCAHAGTGPLAKCSFSLTGFPRKQAAPGQTCLWPPVCGGGSSIQAASSCRLEWNRTVGVSPSISGRRKPARADGTLCVLSSWSGKCLCCSLHSLAAGHSGQPVGDFPPAQHLVDQVLALPFSAVTIKPPTSLQCAPLPSHRYLGGGSEEAPPS